MKNSILTLGTLVSVLLVFIINPVMAQEFDYHLEAYKSLAAGDCERAQKNYNVYREMNKENPDFTPDKELEYQIKLCIDHSKPLYAKDFEVYRDGNKLPDSEVRRLFANTKSYELYDKGMRLEDWDAFGFYFPGALLLTGGAICTGLGLGFMDEPESETLLVVGPIALASGLVLVVVPSIRSSFAKHRIRKAVDLYNNGDKRSQAIMEIDYGLTGNGVYFTLSF